MKRPLVSFLVPSYNHERFVAEAVQGALAQTYSPLEIIISDDGSIDGSFEIAKRAIAAYTGPHAVHLNRNPTNLGIGGHFNRLTELAKGDLLVFAAADDVSLPHRTEVVVQAWNDSEEAATSLTSACSVVDSNGRTINELGMRSAPKEGTFCVHERGTIPGFLRRRRPHASGFAHAISRKLVSLFKSLPTNVAYEDTALSFRTVLIGGLFTFINVPLVKYRRHEDNITFDLERAHIRAPLSFEETQRKRGIELERMLAVYQNFFADTQCALEKGIISREQCDWINNRIRYESNRLELKRQLLTRAWPARWLLFCRLYYNTVRPRDLLTQVPHLLPRDVYRIGFALRNRITSLRNHS